MERLSNLDALIDQMGRNVSRREFLRRSMLLGASIPVGAALLAACADDDEPDAPAAPEPDDDEPDEDEDDEPDEPEPDDEDEDEDEEPDAPMQTGVFSLPLIDNPQIWPVVGGLPNILVNKVIFSTLIKFSDPDLLPIGDLAESWDVSGDGLEWTFNLKTNATWHDGEPVTSDDIVFTINGIWLNPDVSYYLRGNFATIEEAEAVDDHTVALHMHQASYSLPWMLGYLANILPEHILGEWAPENFTDPQEFTRNPVGSGPFRFDEAVPGSHVRVMRYDDFYDGAPQLDGVLFKVIPDIEQQLAQLQTDELDLVLIEPHQLEAVEGRDNIVVREARQVNYTYIAFHNQMEPFTDVQVRQALTHAIDRQAILDNAQLGRGLLANHPISPFMEWAHNDEVEGFAYDPDRAGEMLDEAGWELNDDGVREKDGEALSIVLEVDRGNPVREQTAIFAQQYWREIGVECEIQTSQFNDLLSRVRAGDAADVQAFIMWYITPPHPDITAYYACGQSTNTFHYCNERVDELLVEAQQIEDMDEQAAIYKEIQAIIAEDAPIVFLYYPYELQAMNTGVHGWAQLGYRDALSHMVDVWKD
jgi:peptide/nickel transport system substrate-binding protein